MSQEIENNFEERKKDWDLTGLLDDVIRRYIYQLTNDELNEINLEKASGMPDEEIKNGIKLPLATMQQRRETWGSQSKLDVQEPMIFILQSTVEKLSVGDKIPLSDADSFLIHQESGVLNYELHYLMNGTPQEYNAFLDLSKVKVADTLMDGVTHSTPPALSDYLERHQQLNDTELGAKRLQKLNCDSKNVSYAKSKVALFLVLKENDSSYNFVGNMLYQQLFDELLVEADQNYHGVLPIRVECWMDEFGNGLRPEGFEHLITTLRSRNIAVMLFLQSISQLQTMYKGDGWKVFMDSCAVFLFLGSGRGAYDTQETISKMLGAATIEKASGSVSYGQNGSSSTSYDRLQRSLMDANEVAQMDKDSCIILPFASKPIIDKKYKPFHDPSYLKAKKYGPYTHPVEIFRDKNGNLHTVNHQEKFYFPDEGLQAKIRDDLKEGKSSGMLFELSEDEFCSLDLDDPKLNGPQGNLFLLQQLKKLEDDSATLKLQNAVNEKMNSVIYDTSDNTSSLEADEESAAETISVYDVRQSWDLSGNLEDVIRRYILELSEDEVSNITEAMNRHIPEKKIKDCLTLPPEKLCLMLQFYMKQAN